jgi:hypothetical protein
MSKTQAIAYPKAYQSAEHIQRFNLDTSRYRRVVMADQPDPDLGQKGFYLVQVDPTRAARWLGLNANDRPLSGPGSTFLARQMDRWHPEVRTVKFDTSATLRDGQHGLDAIRKSGSTVLVQVETGVAPEVIRYVDSGMPRSLGARAHFTGGADSDRRIAGIINFWKNYRLAGGHATRLTADDALAFFRQHEEALRWVVGAGNRRIPVLNKPAALAALCEYRERFPGIAAQFAACLFDRESIASQPAVYLRQKLSEGVSKAYGYAGQVEQFLFTVSACVAHREGRTVQALKKRDW